MKFCSTFSALLCLHPAPMWLSRNPNHLLTPKHNTFRPALSQEITAASPSSLLLILLLFPFPPKRSFLQLTEKSSPAHLEALSPVTCEPVNICAAIFWSYSISEVVFEGRKASSHIEAPNKWCLLRCLRCNTAIQHIPDILLTFSLPCLNQFASRS